MNLARRAKEAHPAWFIPAPGPDERLGSVVERAASFYRATADHLMTELLGTADDWSSDLDNCNAYRIAAMARALRVEPRTLWPHRLVDHPRLLAPSARRAACPLCWAEDRAAGRPHGFRRDWAGVLRTTCSRHGVALELSRPDHRGFGSGQSRFDPVEINESSQSWLDKIESFGRLLESALFDRGSWPSDWRLTPNQARAALIAVSTNLSDESKFTLSSQVVCPSFLIGLVKAPKHIESPLRHDGWTAFRAIADPALRRASMWVVAWWTCPEWIGAFSPGWLRRSAVEELPVMRGTPKRAARAVIAELSHRACRPS